MPINCFKSCIKSDVAPLIGTYPKANPIFIGEFENESSEKKSKWDSVTITYNAKLGLYTWKNKAGKAWTLYPSARADELKVGTDCPYYQPNGHLIAKFTVKGVYGPGDELYKRKDVKPLYTGEFLCHLYEKKNTYHYVTVIEDKQNGAYIWRNVAGREWSLKPSGVIDLLTVGEECNYYKDGHKTARYTAFGVHGPGNELYTRKCGNPVLVGNFENHDYDAEGKNDWHYVSISYNHFEDNYTWSNKAAVSWTLYPTERPHVLKVGEDCPYFKDGYEILEVNQMGVYGPGMEFYSKSESKPWLTGKFEHEKTVVTVNYDSTVNRYKLKLNGKVGHLDTTNDERIMSVDKDCPIYVDGNTSARFTHKGIDYNNKLYKRVSL